MLALALVVLVVAGSFAGKFEGVQKNDPPSYLPGKAESVKALDKVATFPGGRRVDAVVVYHRDGGLTAADRAKVARDRAALNRPRPLRAGPVPVVVVSGNRTTALLVAPIRSPRGDSNKLLDADDAVNERVGGGRGGLQVKVTGPAGFSADAIKVFEQINGTLLLATAALVFLLLILIYRSPIFWIIPLLRGGLRRDQLRGPSATGSPRPA